MLLLFAKICKANAVTDSFEVTIYLKGKVVIPACLKLMGFF